jgi:catechol 2,3-dioxygenase-like lactoylglutathione lyase family enzyme
MIDHVSLPVRDLAAATRFYKAVLAPLGLKLFTQRDSSVAFGRKYPLFWLNARPDMTPLPPGHGVHVCLRCRSEQGVDDFHAAALVHGGRSDGAPGQRQAELTGYYAAFIIDPDGNRIEAACFPAVM